MRARVSQQGLAGAGGADEQDVALLEFHPVQVGTGVDPFIVVIDGHGQDLLGPFLADDVFVDLLLDGGRLRDGQPDVSGFVFFVLLGDDVVAQFDALIADVNPGAGDELLHLALALAAEGAQKISIFVDAAFTHRVRPPQT